MSMGAEGICQIVDYRSNRPYKVEVIEGGKPGTGIILEHWHPEVEIVCKISGTAEHYVDGKRFFSHPGDITVVNSQGLHKVYPGQEEEGKRQAIVLLLRRELVDAMIPDYQDKYFCVTESLDREKIISLMTETAELYSRPEQINSLLISSRIYEIMYLLARDGLAPKEEAMPINKQKNQERLRGIMNYVSAHYTERIRQKDVAQRFYFTKEYFARFFRENTGLTFQEYVRRFRVKMAYEELVNTDKTIMEIALGHGFGDARGFINTFKQYYGTTPKQYRQYSKKQDNLT